MKGILFESHIHIEISAGNYFPLTSLTHPLLPTQPIIPYLAVENKVPVTSAPPTVPSPIPDPAVPARAARACASTSTCDGRARVRVTTLYHVEAKRREPKSDTPPLELYRKDFCRNGRKWRLRMPSKNSRHSGDRGPSADFLF